MKDVEIRVAVIGNVDSGKTTLSGVLSHNMLDDGRGSVRNKICRYKHEQDSGRTSSINYHHLKYENEEQTSRKIVSFIDLAGHEKYLKTTMYGIAGLHLDYALLIVGANMGVSRMTKEHLILVVALKIPVIVVVTKIDIAPENVLNDTIQKIEKMFRSDTMGKKKSEVINSLEHIDKFIEEKKMDSRCFPLFCVSNKTGENVNLLRDFLHKVGSNFSQIMKYQGICNDVNNLFVLDDVFQVNGVGLVISGVLKKGTIKKNDTMYFGPFYNKFRQVFVRSIHNNMRESINELEEGQYGCINIKSVSKKENILKKMIKKGMVLIDKNTVKICKRFEAEVIILHHPTTIKVNYQPVVHLGTVRQVVTIKEMKSDLLRTGDRSIVDMEFVYHPEYIMEQTLFFFREGKTKGIGKVLKIIS